MTRLKHSSAQTRRCSLVTADDVLLVEYHDREWGIPTHSDHKHFEVLILSGGQAGLNWSLVLKKRDGCRRAFNKFDPEKVARYSEMKIRKLLSDPEIIRNRMKIEAAVRISRHVISPKWTLQRAILTPRKAPTTGTSTAI